MNGTLRLRLMFVLVTATATTACVPMVVPLYAASSSQGKVLYAHCAINKDVPDGIELQAKGVLAQVKLEQDGARRFVEVRLDVPAHSTVQLQSDVVQIDLHGGRPPIQARYPNVSLVDSPGMHSFDTPAALARYMVPTQAPMVGSTTVSGNQQWPRHFWMAARVDTERAEWVTLTLPGMLVDGVPVTLPGLDFRRSRYAVMAPLNC